MKKSFFVYILVVVISVYFSQGWLYEKGSIISQTMLILWFIIDLYCLFRTINERMFGRFELLLFLFIIVNVLSWLYGDKIVRGNGLIVSTFGDLKNITAFLLSYFPFKYLINKGILQIQHCRLFFGLLLLVFIFTFNANQNSLLKEFDYLDSVTNNYAFKFAMLFPFVGFFFNKKYRYLLVLLMLYFVLIGVKRGAILCLFVEIVLFVVFSMQSYTKKRRISSILGAILILGLVLFMFYSLYEQNDYLRYRLSLTSAGDDSGRRELRRYLISSFEAGSFVDIVFGRGMDQAVAIAGNFAHNDWLQILTDSGIIGFAVYFFIFIYLFSFYRKNRNNMLAEHKFLYLSALSCWFTKAFFSMGYTDITSFIYFIPILYAMKSVKDKASNNTDPIKDINTILR